MPEMTPELRAALKQHILWALSGFAIPEEYHGGLTNDPHYFSGSPVGLVDFLPSIRGVDPASHKLLEQIAEAAVVGVEKALAKQSQPARDGEASIIENNEM